MSSPDPIKITVAGSGIVLESGEPNISAVDPLSKSFKKLAPSATAIFRFSVMITLSSMARRPPGLVEYNLLHKPNSGPSKVPGGARGMSEKGVSEDETRELTPVLKAEDAASQPPWSGSLS